MTTAAETMPPGVGPDEADLRQGHFPPVARLGTLTLAMTVAGGVLMAAEYGKSPPLSAPIALAAAAGAVLIVNVILLSRVKEFAWAPFFRVLRWTLLAYFIIAGILEFVFVFDHTPSKQLALFTVLLFLFATDVPLILAFSVARWQLPAEAA